jgi:hypothetical protein
MGPDDFLKYFISITAEENRAAREYNRSEFLVQIYGHWGYRICSFDLPQTHDTGRHALRHDMMCTSALGICIGFSPR